MINLYDDEYFMRQALIEAAYAAEEGEVPVGAVVVSNDRIIARGHNQTERLKDPTAHAEMLAITGAVNTIGAKYLPECKLYVTLEPCIMCAGAIGWAQVGSIIYGTTDEKKGYEKFAPKAFHPKATVKKGVLEDECREIIRSFFKAKR